MRTLISSLFILVVLQSCSGGDSNAADSDSTNKDSAKANITAVDSSSIVGSYAFGTDPEKEAVGSVIIYPETDSTFLFHLDFNRGAPSYNMGSLSSRAYKKDGAWVYQQNEADAVEGCEIEFMFQKSFLQIITHEKNCGFGGNVMVDHVYTKQSFTPPEFFVGMEGDTVYFRNLAKAVK